LKYAGPLADAVSAGIAKRLTGFFDCSDLILASITLSQFKLRWLDDNGKEQARSLLYSFVRTMQQQQLSDSGSEDEHVSQEDAFFTLATPKQMIDKKLLIQKLTCIRVILAKKLQD
jgi:hypothetical protein